MGRQIKSFICAVWVLTLLVSCGVHSSTQEDITQARESSSTNVTDDAGFPPSSSFTAPDTSPSMEYDYDFVPDGFQIVDFDESPASERRSVVNTLFSEALQHLQTDKNDPEYELDMVSGVLDINGDGTGDLVVILYGTYFHGVHSDGALYVILCTEDGYTAIEVGQGTLWPDHTEVSAWVYCKRNEKTGWMDFYYNGCVYEYILKDKQNEVSGCYRQTDRFFYVS